MKNKSILSTAGILGILVLIFAVSYAQPPRPRLMGITEKLDLTDEQIDNIRDIQYNFRKVEIGLRADLKTSRLELRHLMLQEKSNQKEIDNLVDKIGETQKNLLNNTIKRKLAMKEVLTPEQFEKFIQMKAERREGRMERGPKRPRHHPRQPEFYPRHEGPGF